MRFRKLYIVLISLAFIVLGTACSFRLGDLTMIASKNIELSKMDMYEKCAERSVGEHSVPIIFGIPVGKPDIEEACDRAVEKAGGVFLTDAVITYEFFSFIFGYMKYIVEGDVWCASSKIGSSDTPTKVPDYVLKNSGKGSRISINIPGKQVLSGKLILWGKDIIILADDAGNLHTIPRSEKIQISLLSQ